MTDNTDITDAHDTEETTKTADATQPVAQPVGSDAAEWKAQYLRAIADYRNLEKRTASEKEEIRAYAAVGVVTKLIPVVDMFERASEHLKDQGLAIALKEMHAVLAAFGAKKMDVQGKQFDPVTMECVEAGDDGEETVTDVVAPGWQMHGKVIRHALVRVGKKQA